MSRFLRGDDSNDRLVECDRPGRCDSHRSQDCQFPLASAAIAKSDEGSFAKSDNLLRLEDEPDHDGLCHREQDNFLSAIRDDLDLTDHQDDALASMRMAEGL